RAAGPARFEINPADAHRLGVVDGDKVEVRSKFGKVQGQAVLTDSPRQGVLFAAFYDPNLLVNMAVADHYDPTSKEPEFKATAVAGRKVTAGRPGGPIDG